MLSNNKKIKVFPLHKFVEYTLHILIFSPVWLAILFFIILSSYTDAHSGIVLIVFNFIIVPIISTLIFSLPSLYILHKNRKFAKEVISKTPVLDEHLEIVNKKSKLLSFFINVFFLLSITPLVFITFWSVKGLISGFISNKHSDELVTWVMFFMSGGLLYLFTQTYRKFNRD
jgi:hypothetical protein